MTEETRREGSRIELMRRRFYPETRRVDPVRFRLHITYSSESPREAFEKLFPRYQIGDYRGVGLGRWNNFPFFSQYRWGTLAISAYLNGEGVIENISLTRISSALRHPHKRTPESLGREADFILKKVLPAMKSYNVYDKKDISAWELVSTELPLAFDNMRRDGVIK